MAPPMPGDCRKIIVLLHMTRTLGGRVEEGPAGALSRDEPGTPIMHTILDGV
jgi:hypothetical protein